MSRFDYESLAEQMIASTMKRGMSRQDAEDLVQDALLTVGLRYGWNHFDFNRLVFGVLRNRRFDFLRKCAKQPCLCDVGELTGEPTASLRKPTVWTLHREQLDRLIGRRLSPRQAEVIRLQLRGHSQRAIARDLTMSLGTVASICRRAPQQLSRSDETAELEHQIAG